MLPHIALPAETPGALAGTLTPGAQLFPHKEGENKPYLDPC